MQLEIQREMASAILAAAATERLDVAHIDAVLQLERMAIHARTFRASLVAALAAAFPAVQRLTGEGFFGFAAAQFIAAAPPTSPIVAQYGAAFPEFLADFAPASSLPWLADVARLEWALHELGNVLPGEALGTTGLAGADDAQFGWSPSVRLLSSPFAVDALIEASDVLPGNLETPTHLLLRSAADAVTWRRLALAEYRFLTSLRSGAPLSEAIAHARFIDPAFDFVSALRVACAEGCFTHIHAT